MKLKYVLGVALLAFLTSCGSGIYYQVYKVSPSDKIALKDNKMFYEDENCVVGYNLWDEGGNIGFTVYNKTDKNIYVNLEESFFVLNGVAHNYYKNRFYTNSLNAGGSVSKMLFGENNLSAVDSKLNNHIQKEATSTGFSVLYAEPKVVCVPSKTTKTFSEYSVAKGHMGSCGMIEYPSKKEVITKTYTLNDTPVTFGNRIAYSVGQGSALVTLSHDFYVTDVTNYPENMVVGDKPEKVCNEIVSKQGYLIETAPNKFFVKYKKK